MSHWLAKRAKCVLPTTPIGGVVASIACDVTKEEDSARLAEFAIREFGLWAVVGTIATTITSLTLIPALLVLLGCAGIVWLGLSLVPKPAVFL